MTFCVITDITFTNPNIPTAKVITNGNRCTIFFFVTLVDRSNTRTATAIQNAGNNTIRWLGSTSLIR